MPKLNKLLNYKLQLSGRKFNWGEFSWQFRCKV